MIQRNADGNLTMQYDSTGVSFSTPAPITLTHHSGCTRQTLSLEAPVTTPSMNAVAAGQVGFGSAAAFPPEISASIIKADDLMGLSLRLAAMAVAAQVVTTALTQAGSAWTSALGRRGKRTCGTAMDISTRNGLGWGRTSSVTGTRTASMITAASTPTLIHGAPCSPIGYSMVGLCSASRGAMGPQLPRRQAPPARTTLGTLRLIRPRTRRSGPSLSPAPLGRVRPLPTMEGERFCRGPRSHADGPHWQPVPRFRCGRWVETAHVGLHRQWG